jgi:hypothetical protein
MTEQLHDDSLAARLTSLPQYIDFKEEIKNTMTPEDLTIFGEDAERKIAEGLTSLAAFPPKPSTFDFEAFLAVCAYNLTRQQSEKLMEIAIKTGLVTQDEKTGRYSVSKETHEILGKYLIEEDL